MSKTKYYITTPVYDAASEPEIVPLYTAVLCDAIARHKRMCGFDVAHFIGADVHGVSLGYTEERAGSTQAASFQRNCKKFEELLSLSDVHCTHFQRTFSAEHILAVQTLLQRTMRRSRLAIYKDRYQGRYCVHDQIDVSESTEPADCPTCGRPAVLISEDCHFFRLSAFQDRLMALYKYHPEFIQPHFRLDEVRSTVARGLKDIPISRSSTERGIPWPDDLDRIVNGRYGDLTSYLSGIGFGEGGYGSDEFKKYWPANLHVIGKEALRSHAIYWPAFLMAADLPLPRHVFVHSTLYLEQEGTNKACFTEPLMQSVGSDALRYHLLREVGYGEDARVDFERLISHYDQDLPGSLASLATRILALVARHCNGKIPDRSVFGDVDPPIEIVSGDTRAEVHFLFDSFNFSEGLKKIWSLAATIDKLLTDNAWRELADDPREKRRLTDLVHDACEVLGLIALLLHPILPHATDAIWRSLGQTTRLGDQLIDETPWSCLMPGTSIARLEELFPRVGNAEIQSSSPRDETEFKTTRVLPPITHRSCKED